MSSFRPLYARIVLWLIRPALELHKPKLDQRAITEAVLDDVRNGGPISNALRRL